MHVGDLWQMQAAHNGWIGLSWPMTLIVVYGISGRQRLTFGRAVESA
jgi:hypothetical protein